MKRSLIYIFVFLISLFIFSHFSWAVTVKDLYPAAKVFNSTTKGFSVPGILNAIGVDVAADSTVALALDAVEMANLAGLVAIGVGGFIYAGSALYDYLAAQAVPMVLDGGILKKTTVTMGCRDSACAIAACLAGAAAYMTEHSAEGYANSGNYHIEATDVYCSTWGPGNNPAPYYISVPYGPNSDVVTVTPASQGDVAGAIGNGLTAGEAAAIAAAAAALDAAASVYPSGQTAGKPSMKTASDAVQTNIKNVFNNAITSDQTIAAQAAANGMTPAQYASMVANSAATPLTAAQLTAALTAAGLSGDAIAAAVTAAMAAANVVGNTGNNALTQSQVQAAMAAALLSQGLSANAIAAALAAVTGAQSLTQAQSQAATAAALAAAGLSPAQIASAVASAVAAANPSMTQAQAQAATAAALAAAGLSPAAIASAIKSANPELTSDQVQAAIAAALAAQAAAQAAKDAADAADVPVPSDTLPDVPEKLSLTAVMTSFVSSIGSLPMFQTLQGLHINCSGSSVLCMNLPQKLGGTACFDAGGAVGGINMAGQALLSITSIFMFVWVFRG